MSLTSQFDEQHAEIAALRASEAEFTEGPDAALKLLGPLTDPVRIRAALGILLRADRNKAAADIVRDKRPDEKWIHLAVAAFAFLGEIPRARSLVSRADDSPDPAVMRASRLAFAEGVIEAWQKRRPKDSLLDPKPWPDGDVELAKTVIEILDPLLSAVRANRKITGEYELSAVKYAVYCARIARDPELLSQCIHWLVKYVPIPLLVAELYLRGLTQGAPEGLPNRLRVEHLGDFQASLLAAIVERDLGDMPHAAFDALVELSASATGDDQKESVCIALFETSARCDSEQIEKAIEVVSTLRPNDSRLIGLLHVMKALADDNISEAQQELDAIRDESDGVWWQAQAQICERSGDEAGAERAWEKASDLVPHPDLVRRSIQASIDRRRYQSVIRGVTKLLKQDPDHEQNLNTLAWAETQLGDHGGAALHLKRMVELDPSRQDYRIWLAQALARTAQTADAIEVLKPVCDGEDAPLEAILFLGELLAADNKPVDAFTLLDAIAPDHWDDPRFLFSYMQRAYAARKDRLAEEAFARLLELRREGRVPAELIQEGTLEQLLEHTKNFRSRRESLQEAVIAGRMTWLFAEDALGNPATWAWTLHTQELKWLSEESPTRAALSIYATNSFRVDITSKAKRLAEITAPPAGAEVVADLSALLTLQKLGLLERSAEYFGRLVLPARYGSLHIRDTDRFAHQPSREQSLQTIRECIDAHRIRVESQWPDDIIELDEYSDDPQTHAYRLQDLLPLLKTTQRATGAALAQLSKIARKPSAIDETHPGIRLGDTVLVSLTTLRHLSDQAVFEPVLDALSVSIRATDYEELLSELRAHEAARSARQFHDELWCAVAELAERNKIIWKPGPVPDEPSAEPDADSDDVLFLDSIRLAQHLRRPLLVDDRVLQVLLSHDEEQGPLLAFGSDCVIHAMQSSGAYERSSAARDMRQLLNWRYRFLVPSAEILFAWAEESMEHLPGPALLDAAFYLHDSLRDPALHCGPEQSEPPMPMAAKYVTAWISSTVSFLAKVWSDARFSDEACSALTYWVGEDLIPSCPRGLWYHQTGHNIARAERFSVFSMATVHFTGIADRGRANRALQNLAESLGISEDEYLTAVADAIEASMEKQQAEPEVEKAFARGMMQNALLHLVDGGLDALAFSRFRALGLFTDAAPPPLPQALAAMLQEARHAPSDPAGRGRLAFVREETSISVVDVDSILFHSDRDLRRTAFDYLRAAGESTDPWLTPHTLTVMDDASADVTSEDESRWRVGAISVAAAVRKDFLGLLASFRQSLACNYRDGITQYVNELLAPSFETLAHHRPPVWYPSEQPEEITSWIRDLAQLPAIDDALTGYLDRCGYVPLSRKFGASQLVTQWITAHREAAVTWPAIWEWAVRQETPAARYHAITVALHVPQVRPSVDWDQFWTEVVNIVDVPDSAGYPEQAGARWQLLCELASHFARHIEALHPAQHGESVGCYAWWLSAKLVEALGRDEKNAEWSLRELVLPRARISHFRWSIARSPVVPSPLRYATLHLRSVWAMSLLANLGLAAKALPLPAVPIDLQHTISRVLHGYVLTSHLAHAWHVAEVPFAFQENRDLEELCRFEGYVPDDDRETLAGLMALRRGLSDPEQIASHLDRLLELPLHMQHVLVLALRDLVYSTSIYDHTLEKWLEQTDDLLKLLKAGSEAVVDPLLETCAEFQQHQVSRWPIRLPHIVTHAVEALNDSERIHLLGTHILQMSANAGIGSPVQRLAHSGRWSGWPDALEQWRANLQEMGKQSQPWVAARVRSISSTISRLIGPHRRTMHLADPEDSEDVVRSSE